MRRVALILAASLALAFPRNVVGQGQPALTNADVAKLVAAGVRDETILAAIEEAHRRQFDVTEAGVTSLKEAGVSASVLDAMRRLSPPPPPPPPPVTGSASTLVGLKESELRARLRAPTSMQNGIWYFDSPAGTLRVYVKNGVVSEVHPDNYAINTLSTTPAGTSQQTATTSSAGTIVCRDGTVSDAAHRQGACSSHGGIATTKKKKGG